MNLSPRAGPNVITTLLAISEKLLILAEAQTETQLADTKSRQRFRRELAEQLSNIETEITRLRGVAREPTDPPLLTRSEIWPLIKTIGPYVVAVSGWLFHLIRPLF